MARIISVINQKGGVGKSTTAEALASGLAITGKKVLCIDLDAQRNLSYVCMCMNTAHTAADMLQGTPAKDCITHAQRYDIIAGSAMLAGADLFLTAAGKEHRIKEALEPLRAEYDYIVIDTPPALGILTVNALTASDDIIIPAQADIFSLQGITQLWETVRPVKQYYNPTLNIAGILITRYSGRATLAKTMREALEDIAVKMNTKVFNAAIRESTAIKEAILSQQSIFDYDSKAKAAADYTDFINEYVKG